MKKLIIKSSIKEKSTYGGTLLKFLIFHFTFLMMMVLVLFIHMKELFF